MPLSNIKLISAGALSIYIVVTGILSLLYPQYFMGIIPLLENMFFIVLLVLFYTALQRKSYELDFNNFIRVLFVYTVLLCLFYIAIQYLLSYYYTPEKFPFDIGISDNYEYDRNGKLMKSLFIGERNLSDIMRNSQTPHSDMGFPFIIGFFYSIFGDFQLPIKLFNAISVAITSVFIAKTVREVAKEKIAKTTGIVYAIIPTVGYLSGFFLKESIMMMLVSLAFFFIVKSIKSFSVLYLIGIIVVCFTLFYFRSYLASCVLVVFFIGNTLQYKKGIYSTISIILFILLAMGLLSFSFSNPIQDEVEKSLLRLTADEQYFAEKVQTSSDLAKLGAPILLVLSPIFPLPSMLDLRSSVNIESIGVLYRVHIDIVRIIMLFWAYLGVYNLIKRKQLKYFIIFLAPLLLLVIINSIVGVLTYFRYQYMILLFLSPFIACGLNSFYYNYKRNVRLYIGYCIIVFLLILVYNIIRVDYV